MPSAWNLGDWKVPFVVGVGILRFWAFLEWTGFSTFFIPFSGTPCLFVLAGKATGSCGRPCQGCQKQSAHPLQRCGCHRIRACHQCRHAPGHSGSHLSHCSRRNMTNIDQPWPNPPIATCILDILECGYSPGKLRLWNLKQWNTLYKRILWHTCSLIGQLYDTITVKLGEIGRNWCHLAINMLTLTHTAGPNWSPRGPRRGKPFDSAQPVLVWATKTGPGRDWDAEWLICTQGPRWARHIKRMAMISEVKWI